MQIDLHRILDMVASCGCHEARLALSRNIDRTLSVVNGQTDKILHNEVLSLAVTLYIEGREGFFFTNVLDDDTLWQFIRRSVEATRLLAPDPARGLPEAHRYYQGGGADLRNCDERLLAGIDMPSLAQHDFTFPDPRVIHAETTYSDRVHQAKYLTTNGFEASEQSTHLTLSTLYSVRGEGDARPMDGWGQTRLFAADMPSLSSIDTIALERALSKIGQRPVPAGRYTLVVESPVAGSLLTPLLSAMLGTSLQQHTSFLEGRLGEQVGSPLLDIVDNPHLPGTRGATYFDYDGSATRPMPLFTKGRLDTYFIDTPMSRKLQMAPTTQGPHHLIFTPSTYSLEEVLCQQEECILVTDFNGGNCNPVTGHFSYGVEGFLYRKGTRVQPLSGMNITGNILELWQHLIQVANDADPYEVDLIPSLVFADVSFC